MHVNVFLFSFISAMRMDSNGSHWGPLEKPPSMTRVNSKQQVTEEVYRLVVVVFQWSRICLDGCLSAPTVDGRCIMGDERMTEWINSH